MGEEQARGASPPAPKRARLEPGERADAGGADVVAQQQAENKASGRTGGIYVPPFKIAALRKQTAGLDASSREFQKLSWESLRKGINGHVNKVNVSNIRSIVPELLELNLVRARGLLCRALMKAQLVSPGFTHIYAALAAVLNTKLPENGELLLKRVIAHELVALQLLTVLLDEPTDDSVEIAVNFTKEVGQLLDQVSPAGLLAVFERFRGILHEGAIDKRVQYTIEGLFALRKTGFLEYPAVPEELDLDLTETDLVNLRRTIYLTIMSSVGFEECAHKLMKLDIRPGLEMELCNMLIECCSQERTYLRYYGLLGQRFCVTTRVWQDAFDKAFEEQYAMIHRLRRTSSNAKFFAHLLHTDSLPWTCLEYVRLNEEETTSSSRIFIKILMQDLAENLGLPTLRDRFDDQYMRDVFAGLFPRENPRDTRFSINFFTSIGLGGLTDALRKHLKDAPKLVMQQQMAAAKAAMADDDGSDSDSDSSSSSSSSGGGSTTSPATSAAAASSTTSASSGSSAARRGRGPAGAARGAAVAPA
ncbi:hypothetical protein JL721_4090 [Aureococcus anophagefferens]|nr:hypothetical protein JL721_4090 [Aureococcus anophagefferens]